KFRRSPVVPRNYRFPKLLNAVTKLLSVSSFDDISVFVQSDAELLCRFLFNRVMTTNLVEGAIKLYLFYLYYTRYREFFADKINHNRLHFISGGYAMPCSFQCHLTRPSDFSMCESTGAHARVTTNDDQFNLGCP